MHLPLHASSLNHVAVVKQSGVFRAAQWFSPAANAFKSDGMKEWSATMVILMLLEQNWVIDVTDIIAASDTF